MDTKLTPVFVALSFSLLALTYGLSDSKETKDYLDRDGFTNIEITGWSPGLCYPYTLYATGFTALRETGERVDGVRCVSAERGVYLVLYIRPTE